MTNIVHKKWIAKELPMGAWTHVTYTLFHATKAESNKQTELNLCQRKAPFMNLGSSMAWSLTLLVVCFGLAACSAKKGASDDLSELRVVDRNLTGNVGFSKQYFRGERKVYSEYVRTNLLARLYFSDGLCVVTETDEDGDGVLETITLFPNDLRKLEVFRRQADGTVRPLESKELRELREKIIRAHEEFQNAQTNTKALTVEAD